MTKWMPDVQVWDELIADRWRDSDCGAEKRFRWRAEIDRQAMGIVELFGLIGKRMSRLD